MLIVGLVFFIMLLLAGEGLCAGMHPDLLHGRVTKLPIDLSHITAKFTTVNGGNNFLRTRLATLVVVICACHGEVYGSDSPIFRLVDLLHGFVFGLPAQ